MIAMMADCLITNIKPSINTVPRHQAIIYHQNHHQNPNSINQAVILSAIHNGFINESLKASTGEDKPDGYLKALYSQPIVDYRKYIEEMGPIVEVVRGQVGQLKAVIEEMRVADEFGVAFMRLQQDHSDAEFKLGDLEHWVKKVHMGIDEKRRLLGDDW